MHNALMRLCRLVAPYWVLVIASVAIVAAVDLLVDFTPNGITPP